MKKLLFAIFIPIFTFGQEFYPIEPMHPIRYWGIFLNKLEYREKKRSLNLDFSSFYGGDYHKLWFVLEAKSDLKEGKWEFERADLLFGRAISSFFDLRIGGGYAGKEDEGRAKLVVDLFGLAPYWLETELNLNLSHKGELYGKLKAEYDLLLTQRLVLQPEVEVLASAKTIEPLEIGKGISKVGLSIRLRYEIKREIAPYVGFSWERNYGKTKELKGKAEESTFLVGLKMWF
ncbi:copper resistance protein B [Thermocrinis sp.]|uniref:copper resistance protein B n=1 Tax=Thermocrinis sp. TaxID=2024383 RepID=UPI002FDEDA87